MKRSSIIDNLNEFAASHPVKKGPTCSICLLPPEILKAIHEARGRHPLTVVAKWLVSIGYPVLSRQRLAHHFQDGHAERFNAKQA